MVQVNGDTVDLLGLAKCIVQSNVHTCCGAVAVVSQNYLAANIAPATGKAGIAIGEKCVVVNVDLNLGVLYGNIGFVNCGILISEACVGNGCMAFNAADRFQIDIVKSDLRTLFDLGQRVSACLVAVEADDVAAFGAYNVGLNAVGSAKGEPSLGYDAVCINNDNVAVVHILACAVVAKSGQLVNGQVIACEDAEESIVNVACVIQGQCALGKSYELIGLSLHSGERLGVGSAALAGVGDRTFFRKIGLSNLCGNILMGMSIHDGISAVAVDSIHLAVCDIALIVAGNVHTCQSYALCQLELQSEHQRLSIGNNLVKLVQVQSGKHNTAVERAGEILPNTNFAGSSGDAIDSIAGLSVQKSEFLCIVIQISFNEDSLFFVRAGEIHVGCNDACLVDGNINVPIVCSAFFRTNKCFQLCLQFCSGVACGYEHRTANGHHHCKNKKSCKCLFHVIFSFLDFCTRLCYHKKNNL